MGRELTERQAELLEAVRLIDTHHKALKAQADRVQEMLESAIKAAAVEGVRQRQLAVETDLTDGRISQVVKKPEVKPWWTPDGEGVSQRDEWQTWMSEHPLADPPA
jgi:hypothetical protein